MKNPFRRRGKRRHERIGRHYDPHLAAGHEDFRALDWASEQSQQARFAVLLEAVELQHRALLDVGCGLGHLLDFLQEREIDVHYTGVDLLEEMVQRARARHPEGRFLCGDPFGETMFAPGSFQVAFCSGIFNLNLGNNREFLVRAVRHLLTLADEHVAFNLLHARAGWGARDEYYHFEPADVLELLAPLPCSVRLIEDYLPNDFTVVCTPDAGGPPREEGRG
jgi:SAM-dependent methyltransferase